MRKPDSVLVSDSAYKTAARALAPTHPRVPPDVFRMQHAVKIQIHDIQPAAPDHRVQCSLPTRIPACANWTTVRLSLASWKTGRLEELRIERESLIPEHVDWVAIGIKFRSLNGAKYSAASCVSGAYRVLTGFDCQRQQRQR